MFKLESARREKVKLMVGLMGPSGSGKTKSALRLAAGITGDLKKVALIDTENRSSLYYADNDFKFIDFPSTTVGGYHPNNWIKVIEFAEKQPGIELLILDSISHEWEGKGGCLELADRAKGASGWKTVTPLHRRFIDKMRESPLHIIATMRSKTDYAFETNEKGKTAPKKVGTKATQREGTDYEFGVVLDINIDHYAQSNKDRTGLFAEKGIFQISEDTGKELIAWANSGISKRLETQAEKTTENTPMEIYKGKDTQKLILVDFFDVFVIKEISQKKYMHKYLIDSKTEMRYLAEKIEGKLKSGDILSS